MKEYEGIRESLVEFLRCAKEEDYDAVYYFIGKYDFDQSDPRVVETVADLVLEKATSGKNNPYFGKSAIDRYDLLYHNGENAPDILSENIWRRKRAEMDAEQRGMVYIPDSQGFVHLASAALGLKTVSESGDEDRRIAKSRTLRGQFASGIKDQLKNPYENIGIGTIILCVVVVLYVIVGILYR